MELSKQVCTLEQAKKLKELGIEGSCMHHFQGGVHREAWGDDYCPAFSVAELGVMLPDICLSRIYKRKWMCWTDAYNPGFSGDTEAEARAAMLIYLLENNHTTPEEVNQRLNQ